MKNDGHGGHYGVPLNSTLIYLIWSFHLCKRKKHVAKDVHGGGEGCDDDCEEIKFHAFDFGDHNLLYFLSFKDYPMLLVITKYVIITDLWEFWRFCLVESDRLIKEDSGELQGTHCYF